MAMCVYKQVLYDMSVICSQLVLLQPNKNLNVHFGFSLDLYYGGEAFSVEQPQAFTCPYCGRMGYTEISLQEHVAAEHTETSTEVVCLCWTSMKLQHDVCRCEQSLMSGNISIWGRFSSHTKTFFSIAGMRLQTTIFDMFLLQIYSIRPNYVC